MLGKKKSSMRFGGDEYRSSLDKKSEMKIKKANQDFRKSSD